MLFLTEVWTPPSVTGSLYHRVTHDPLMGVMLGKFPVCPRKRQASELLNLSQPQNPLQFYLLSPGGSQNTWVVPDLKAWLPQLTS